ncbi:MAG: nitrile hydratase subunit alpha [Rhodospirillaceae bacterium]|jgi:nitrile hydratase|nr:nitrile hydratase subunit alpha [Rhodospirillaceae bacterium]MBT3887027.1 nitrile hydratase subunit alpha [Rhodospirillaceae bacterium]MBT4115741.1 nitrile hydratase subunit alpha [Rhodospirillaceae bacterium]MBT4673364.1 nitrile hydratase subunit alpha [Rhodospirillaceae bacterium]MBT4750005.1 nitrile hydratase subunit alpha [Rhodospirillaceae bacterium]
MSDKQVELNEHGHELLAWSDDSRHDVDEADHYVLMADAIRDLLIEKGVIKAGDVREQLEFMDSRSEDMGARIVARAWANPDFKERLLANGTEAIKEFDIPMLDAELVVVENTNEFHNMVVCTLCSCYPRTILGMPPDWYKSKTYRSRSVNEPRAVLKEFGTDLADDVAVRVHDSNADMRYLVLPLRPEGTDGWSEPELAKLVSRDSMIGVSPATEPATEPET